MNYTFEIVITEDDLKEIIAKQYGVPKEMIRFSVDRNVTCIIKKQGNVSKEVVNFL